LSYLSYFSIFIPGFFIKERWNKGTYSSIFTKGIEQLVKI